MTHILTSEGQRKETHFNLSVNYFCNQKCIFCSEGDQEQFYFIRDQTVEVYMQQIREMRAKYDNIMFTSGEPTLNKHLFEYAQYARECGYAEIGLITNGATLIDDAMRRNVCAYMDYLIVSIHAAHAEVHDKLVGGRGVFDRTLRGLILFMKEKPAQSRVDISFVLNRWNLKEIYPHLSLFVGRIGVNRVLINTMRPDWYGGEQFSTLSVRYNYFSEHMKTWTDEQKRIFVSWVQRDRVVATDIPLCVLKQSFRTFHSIDILRLYGKMEIVEKNAKDGIEIFDNNQDKEFASQCQSCLDRILCEGVYSEYLESFWTGELSPIY